MIIYAISSNCSPWPQSVYAPVDCSEYEPKKEKKRKKKRIWIIDSGSSPLCCWYERVTVILHMNALVTILLILIRGLWKARESRQIRKLSKLSAISAPMKGKEENKMPIDYDPMGAWHWPAILKPAKIDRFRWQPTHYWLICLFCQVMSCTFGD